MLWTRPTSYRCGHFANAWEKLRAKYETDKKPDLQEEQEKYYSKRMKEKESPETFILGMEIMRSKLENLGEVIPEDKFIKDLISKLPKSKAAGQLSPYQLKADAWKVRVGAVVDPLTVEDLTTAELQKLYMTMYPKKDE